MDVATEGNYIYTESDLLVPKEPAEAPKVMFEEDSWQITPPSADDDPWDVFAGSEITQVSHYCPSIKWRAYVFQDHLVTSGVCPECNEPVPDSVLTLWKLQNSKHIGHLTEMAESQDFSWIQEREYDY
jgi:hypothetical protein